MQESPFYDIVLQRGIAQGMEQGIAQGMEQGIAQGMEQGMEQGALATAIKNIIAVLEMRFPESQTHTATQVLETISDIERLTQLHNTALLTPSFNAFLQALET